MKIPLNSCRALVAFALTSTQFCAHSGELMQADQVLASLLREPPAPVTRAFRPRANPDAITRVCDQAQNEALLQSTGQRGEQLTRTLYVDSAPQVDLDIAFQRGEATLLPEGKTQLDAVALAIKSPKLANEKFVLAGHTDTEGGADYNDRLSCERSLSVREYLRTKHGIEVARLIPMGFGYQKLKDPAAPRSEVNRRVELRRYTSQ